MSEPKNLQSKYLRLVVFVVFLTLIVLLIVRHLSVFGNILMVMLGFGAVVIVHEFGHFIVAKLSDIEVEAFSIFMPPTLLGLKRTEKGIRIRVLPDIFPSEDYKKSSQEKENEGEINFTIGKKGKAGETEYRIGLIPFGGFVKMLGQEDIGEVKTTDNPRSYANKPVYIRAATLAAGVTFNIISAIIIFMVVFLIGIDLPPAVVGSVVPNGPAARAGIKAGDEFIKIDGKYKDIDFTDIAVAAALSKKNQEIPVTVEHTDGSIEEFQLVAEVLTSDGLRLFGVNQEESLTIAKLNKADANTLYENFGLQTDDRIIQANGQEIRGHWEIDEMIQNSSMQRVTLSAERKTKGGETEIVETSVRVNMNISNGNGVESESDLANIYSIVPRIHIIESVNVPETLIDDTVQPPLSKRIAKKLTGLWNKILGKKIEQIVPPKNPLQAGDIILEIEGIQNPTYLELLKVVEENKDKEVAVKVLRKDSEGIEQTVTVTVTPRQPVGSDRVLIGIVADLDAEHPVVARTISVDQGLERLDIPSGARITDVDGLPVSNFFEVIKEINKYPGQRITIGWRINEEEAGSVAINVDPDKNYIRTRVGSLDFASMPFTVLKRSYKANGPIQAIAMGYRRTVSFAAQAYVTLRRLIGGLVSPSNLMGPIGIMTTSYRIVSEQSNVYYVYFLGLISSVIAVFNFLPLPPLDGGLVVLLLIEKIKGSALSERVQAAVAYTGWMLILILFLYVTFNDIVRSFFS